MNLFEFIKVLFSDPYKWKSITNGDKKKNHFMVNRMMSINYPLHAQAFNHLKIDPVSTINFWQQFMSNIYNRVPFWIYTKGAKKHKEAREKKLDIKETTIKKYSKFYSLDVKSVRDAINFFPKESASEFKKFEKIFK